MSLGGLRRIIQSAAVIGLAIGVAGIIVFVWTGSRTQLMLYHNLLAACVLVILMIVVVQPRLSARCLALQNRRVLAGGTLFFAAEALYNNLSRPLGLDPPQLLDHLGFGVFLFSLGYVALQMVFTNERRLLAMENELDIARKIQMAILPSGVPDLQGLRISAAYRPMTAVAGDYYEFVREGPKRVGILVADVAGTACQLL